MANELYEMTVRVFYRKLGRIKYISHLDLVRCVSRCLKRSGLPVWHTLGFNPHIYVTFALPLALGYESECESMDFRLVQALPLQQVVDRLNQVFPQGLEAYRAAPVVQKPEAIAWAEYEITQEFGQGRPEEAGQALEAFCAQPEILVMKRTKKGEKQLDVKPLFSILERECREGALWLRMRTAAGAQKNINPTLVLDAFAAQTGWRADWTRVVRKRILNESLEDFQ